MSWNYADHSHEVKEHGGPEQYIKDIHDGGVAEGRIQGGATVGIAAIVIGVMVELGRRIYNSKITKAETAKKILEAELKPSVPTEAESKDVPPVSKEKSSTSIDTEEMPQNLDDPQDVTPKNSNNEKMSDFHANVSRMQPSL